VKVLLPDYRQLRRSEKRFARLSGFTGAEVRLHAGVFSDEWVQEALWRGKYHGDDRVLGSVWNAQRSIA